MFKEPFVFLLVGLFLCSFTLLWKKHKTYAYTIEYPRAWSIDLSGKLGTDCVFKSPLEFANDDFAENVNVIVQDVSELNFTLNKYVEITLQQIRSMLQNGQILLNERVRGKGPEFQRLIYTSTFNKRNLKFEQYIWVRNQQAYVVTYSSEEKQYEKYRKVAQKILNSFRFRQKEL